MKVPVGQVEINPAFMQQGFSWKDYLELIPRSRAYQEKRYQSALDQSTIAAFRRLDFHGFAMILTHPQCNDCAFSVPMLARFFDETNGIELRLFHRAEYPELVEMFPSNGKLSVPKLVVFSTDFHVAATWGPRPGKIQEYVEESVGKVEKSIWFKEVMKFYRSEGLTEFSQEIRVLANQLASYRST